jgi:hypothetical protein
MSFRDDIAPAMPNPELADVTVGLDATPAEVDAAADASRMGYLRVFARDRNDWRLRRFVERLASHGFAPGDFSVYVWETADDASGRWTML